MRISITVAHRERPESPRGSAGRLEHVVRTADEIGLDTVWLADRFGADAAGSPDEALLEAYTTLGFLASRSERVRLGALANPAAHRAPAPVVRAVTTLDVLSGGRAWLGVGPGVTEHEAAATGPVTPTPTERFVPVEDLLRLAHRTWTGHDSPFLGGRSEPGRRYAGPSAAQRPRVLIAGHGEARMLPLVARYADACGLRDVPDSGATLRRKLDILAVHCRKLGRPVSGIDISVGTRLRPGEAADELADRCRQFADLGVGHMVLTPEGSWTPAALETLAVAVPAIRDLGREAATAAKVAHLDAYRLSAVGIPV